MSRLNPKSDDQATRLKGILQNMTDEQTLSAAQKFDLYAPGIVEDGISSYCETNDAFSLPKLIMALRVAKSKDSVPRASAPYRYVRALRRDARERHPAAARRIDAMSDAEFMLRTGWGWAHPIIDLPGEVKQRSDLALEKIRREVCEVLAAECGLSQAAAEQYAPGCLGSKNDLENYLNALHEIVQGPQEAEIPEFAR